MLANKILKDITSFSHKEHGKFYQCRKRGCSVIGFECQCDGGFVCYCENTLDIPFVNECDSCDNHYCLEHVNDMNTCDLCDSIVCRYCVHLCCDICSRNLCKDCSLRHGNGMTIIPPLMGTVCSKTCPGKLQEKPHFSPEEVRQIYKEIFEPYGGVELYMKDCEIDSVKVYNLVCKEDSFSQHQINVYLKYR